jgi:acetyltransferase-like isoleucine patch superfamily enzyme
MDLQKRADYIINNYRHPKSFNAWTKYWMRFWMRLAGVGFFGRIAARFAVLPAPPHKARPYLAHMNPRGYIAPSVTIYHSDLRLGKNIFMDERVVIFQRKDAGPIAIGERVCIYRDTILETAHGGYLEIGDDSSIHPRCQVNAYVAPIQIGRGVMIAPNCAFYSYDHGVLPDKPVRKQPLQSKGAIIIEDEAWIGFGTIVLSGVRIGKGAVVGAGSVVTQDIPDGAIAVGNPARVVKMRADMAHDRKNEFV